MKGIITMAVAAACGIAIAESEISSANVVGYTSQGTSDKYNVSGFCFASIGSSGKATFNSMVAEGWNYENDTLRVVNPSSGGSSKKVVWLTADEAKDGGVGEKAGWYDADEFTFEGDTEFDLGSGFMTSLVSKDVSFMYSGEVYDQAFTIPCDGKKYVIVPNALPRKMKLSEMIATGWNYENDQLRLLNKSTGGSSKKFVWLTADEAKDGGVGDKAGWYDADEFTYEGDTEVDPGDGFMTSLVSASVKISLPAAITAK